MKSNYISIIVPIFNAEKYINKCIDSLLNQTKKELEIILVNDGSTDNTENIIKNYKDKRIKYYKNKNQGIGKSRNFGITKATGKYIMFIDSDDYIEDNACELLFEKAEKDNLDIVICDFYREFDNGTKTKDITPSFNNTTLRKTPELIYKVNLSPWNKLYKTALIKNNNIFFNEDYKYEDTPFVFISLDKAKKIGKVNQCLNHYIIHNNSETTVRDERCFDIFKIIDIVRDYFKDKKYAKESIDKWTVWIITNFTIQQRVQKSKQTALAFIDHAFEYLEKNIPDYKKNKYYQNRGILKRTIEKNKLLTKIYCSLYRRTNHVKKTTS